MVEHRHSYSLLCGVQELILAAAAVTDPDARVCPETADCINIALFQMGDLHCVHFLQLPSIMLKDSERCFLLNHFMTCSTSRVPAAADYLCDKPKELAQTSTYVRSSILCVFMKAPVYYM